MLRKLALGVGTGPLHLLPTVPWSRRDVGAGQLQQGQDVPGVWEASVNMDKSSQSLNKKWDSAFVSRRHSGQRIIKMAAEWSVRRNPIKGNCHDVKSESQSWGSSSQEELETLSQKESVRTIYLVYPVSKKIAKNRGTFSARIPIKAALKQKTVKSVKPAANWLHGKCLISNIERLKYSLDSFF